MEIPFLGPAPPTSLLNLVSAITVYGARWVLGAVVGTTPWSAWFQLTLLYL